MDYLFNIIFINIHKYYTNQYKDQIIQNLENIMKTLSINSNTILSSLSLFTLLKINNDTVETSTHINILVPSIMFKENCDDFINFYMSNIFNSSIDPDMQLIMVTLFKIINTFNYNIKSEIVLNNIVNLYLKISITYLTFIYLPDIIKKVNIINTDVILINSHIMSSIIALIWKDYGISFDKCLYNNHKFPYISITNICNQTPQSSQTPQPSQLLSLPQQLANKNDETNWFSIYNIIIYLFIFILLVISIIIIIKITRNYNSASY